MLQQCDSPKNISSYLRPSPDENVIQKREKVARFPAKEPQLKARKLGDRRGVNFTGLGELLSVFYPLLTRGLCPDKALGCELQYRPTRSDDFVTVLCQSVVKEKQAEC